MPTQKCPTCDQELSLKWIRRGKREGVYVYPVHQHTGDRLRRECPKSRQEVE